MIVFVLLPIQVRYLFLLGALIQGLKQHMHRNSKARPEKEQFKFVAYFYNDQE